VDDFADRVVVGVSGSVGSLHALRRAVAEARLRSATLWSVLARNPAGGGRTARHGPGSELLEIWKADAPLRLRTAWQQAVGGIPTDLAVRLFVVEGHPGQLLVQLANRDTDLLVVGSGSSGTLRRMLGGSVAAYCAAHAQCGVLTVPPPPLERLLGRGSLRRTLARRRLVHDLMRASRAPISRPAHPVVGIHANRRRW
jgi:nucleotide-binding universal stress UspA family protein